MPVRIKKADEVEHPEVFHHIGLLFNGPPGAGQVALYLVIRVPRVGLRVIAVLTPTN
jgi:hypothetical protein